MALAMLDLPLVHAFHIMPDHEVQDGVVDIHGLDDHRARVLPSPRPPRHLGHELEGPFMGPHIGEAHQVVRIEDAHHAHMVEIQSLGHHLGTHQDVDTAFPETGQQAVHGVLAPHGVLVHPPDAGLGEQRGQFLLDLLRAEAQHLQARAAAAATDGGRWIMATAVVAAQLVLLLVVGQAHVALVTLGDPAAGLALPHRHVAAPVLEDDGLLSTVQGLLHGVDQRAAEMATHGLPFVCIPQVDPRDVRHGHIAETREQFHVPELPGLGIVQALHGRRGGAQERACPVQGGQDHGHVAGMVPWCRVVLLVAGVVLLIHHHETELRERQEQGRTGSHHDGCRPIALCHGEPKLGALVHGHA